MKQDKGHELKPKLRFPEFQDKPGWSETKLADVLTEHGLKNDGKSKVHSVSVHKRIVDQIEHLGRSFAAADKSNYNLVKPHDVVYTKSPTGDFPYGIVKENRHEYNVIVSPLYGVFSPINKHLGYILDSYFESPIRTNNYLAPITQKGAKNTIQISNETFLSKGIFLPSDEKEQQKIAEFLTSLDELIVAEGQKLEALKAYKNGMLQQVFPREGETIPRLRFPEFRHAPEWRKKALEEALTPKLRKRKKPPEAYKGLGIRSHCKGTFLKNLQNPEKNSMEYLYEVHSDDLLVNITFAWEGAVAIAKKTDAGALVSQRFPTYIFKTNVAIPEFFQYRILDKRFIYNLGLISPGGAGRNRVLNRNEFLKVSILLPEIDEQRRIAQHLSSLDELIYGQDKKIDTLKAHKKGMMQQLFPSADVDS